MHQVDTSKLELLHNGRDKSEVEEILGKPSFKKRNDTQWWYDGKKSIWCGVMISFDKNGKYQGTFHDH